MFVYSYMRTICQCVRMRSCAWNSSKFWISSTCTQWHAMACLPKLYGQQVCNLQLCAARLHVGLGFCVSGRRFGVGRRVRPLRCQDDICTRYYGRHTAKNINTPDMVRHMEIYAHLWCSCDGINTTPMGPVVLWWSLCDVLANYNH